MSNFIPAGDGGHTGWRAAVQKLGGNLAGMVIPNIGAFIAWGLLTALFIPTGWTPNEQLAAMVGPMIVNLLPILIGYTGGRLVHGQRGAVIGAVATVGVIVGTSIPMFLGAMIIGPLAAWVLKKIDSVLDPVTPPGFEMLIGNFSLGISGLLMAILGFPIIIPQLMLLVRLSKTAFSEIFRDGAPLQVILLLLALDLSVILLAVILYPFLWKD